MKPQPSRDIAVTRPRVLFREKYCGMLPPCSGTRMVNMYTGIRRSHQTSKLVTRRRTSSYDFGNDRWVLRGSRFTSLRLVARHSAGRTFGLWECTPSWKWQFSSNVTQTQRILSYWINADGAKVLGKKEQHGFRLLHALYAIPSFRLLLLLSYPYNLKQLHVVLTHLYSSESSRYQLVESRKRLKSTDLDLLTLEWLRVNRLGCILPKMIRRIGSFAFLNILDALEYVCT